MKLLYKTSINYLLLTICVLSLSGFLLYGFLYVEISEEIEEQLQLQNEMVCREIANGRTVNFPLVKTQIVDDSQLKRNPIFKDTLIYDEIQKKNEGYYLLRQPRLISGKVYMVEVMTTHIGWGGYSRAILLIFLFIAVSLVIIGSIIYYFSNRKILAPFILNLKILKNYSVSSTDKLNLVNSEIDEFQELNSALIGLADRAKAEYGALKEFTENASHEIQTPLSIIQTRLERISQYSVDEKMAGFITDAKAALNRLSKVSKGLLLLAKIENRSFPDHVEVNLKAIIEQQINQRQDIIVNKKLDLKTDLKSQVVSASHSLMEILISNLFSNMLTHANSGAAAKIILNNEELVFMNSGTELTFDRDKLFKRFNKAATSYKGNGLGLPIVKQISKLYNWNISYEFLNGNHIFKISF